MYWKHPQFKIKTVNMESFLNGPHFKRGVSPRKMYLIYTKFLGRYRAAGLLCGAKELLQKLIHLKRSKKSCPISLGWQKAFLINFLSSKNYKSKCFHKPRTWVAKLALCLGRRVAAIKGALLC